MPKGETKPGYSKDRIKIEDFDVYKLRKTLSDDEKELVFSILNFDYLKLKDYKNKKMYLFTTGHVHQDPTSSWKETPLSMLKILGKFKKESGPDVVWLYKLHPSLGIYDLTPDIRSAFPDMIEIPASIPFEAMILADIIPEKILLTGSSLGFWVRPDQILKYISHPFYDEAMIKYHYVTREKFIYPHIPEINPSQITYNINGSNMVPEYTKDRYCKQSEPYKCGSLEEISPNCIMFNWDGEETKTLCKKNEIYQ